MIFGRTIARIKRDKKSQRIWREYGDRTKYQMLEEPSVSVDGAETYGIPEILSYDDNTVKIGRYCSIANGVKIFRGGNHHTKWVSTFPFVREPQLFPRFTSLGQPVNRLSRDVIIEDDVWIGYGALLLPGTHVHTGAVVGGGSIVAGEIPPYAIAVGNPCKVIKYRFSERQIAELLNIRWWEWSHGKVNEKLHLICSDNIDAFIEDYHKEMNKLISVIVITYNSSRYVIDTLESVKAQDYRNIELIVSDDCSTDDTFDRCRRWVEANAGRFVRTAVVQTSHNGGICANYNRGLQEVSGEWVKYIAGDDMLMPDCISEFVKTTVKTEEKMLVCGTLHFINSTDTTESRMVSTQFGSMTVSEQREFLVKEGTVIEGPSLFLETETLRRMGGFEEQYPFVEDWPLCMKYLMSDLRIGLVEKYLIRYRVYPESVSRSNPRFSSSIFAAIDYYAPRAAWKDGMYLWWYHHKTNAIVRKFTPPIRQLVGYSMRLFDVIQWKKKLFKNNKQ